jgi:hypothetical protein
MRKKLTKLQMLYRLRDEEELAASVSATTEAAKRRMRERLDGRSVDAIRAEALVFRGVRWPGEWERRAA